MVVTGEIPDARTVRVMRAVVHPTVARWLIATAPAKIKYSTGCLWNNNLGLGGGGHGGHCGDRRVALVHNFFSFFFLF